MCRNKSIPQFHKVSPDSVTWARQDRGAGTVADGRCKASLRAPTGPSSLRACYAMSGTAIT
eukprot:1090819-Rhodomonas_salina.1